MVKRSKPSRRGATTVEFAIVAPVFFTMALGVFEFGRGFMVQQLLTATARQACRYAIIPGRTSAQIESLASSTLSSEGVSGSTTTVLVNDASADASTAKSNDEITVTVTVPVSSITIVPAGGYLTGTLSSQFTMRRE